MRRWIERVRTWFRVRVEGRRVARRFLDDAIEVRAVFIRTSGAAATGTVLAFRGRCPDVVTEPGGRVFRLEETEDVETVQAAWATYREDATRVPAVQGAGGNGRAG